VSKKYWAVTGALGCVTLLLAVAVIAIPLFVVPLEIRMALNSAGKQSAPAATAQSGSTGLPLAGASAGQNSLVALYQQTNPGVVSIEVATVRGGTLRGAGAGSGFIYDDQGHIVTNNHVVDGATQVAVIFYNGQQAEASIVGTDPNSDLAVIKVDRLANGAHPLPLGDSDRVAVGESVIAIGNPFALGNSMTAGIVSAVGRTIDSGATPFSIPRAIQTDAAINHGNSGGPLLNLSGQVIGVNAQIASETDANAGVGFAIPSNMVGRVVPALIEKGAYAWPWLGVSGGSVNLSIVKANNLSVQEGAYIDSVTANGPAAKAGLRGSSGTRSVDGVDVPTGGDVIVAIDNTPITDFDTLLVEVASHKPGDQVRLTVLRGGQRQQVTVTLGERPSQ